MKVRVTREELVRVLHGTNALLCPYIDTASETFELEAEPVEEKKCIEIPPGFYNCLECGKDNGPKPIEKECEHIYQSLDPKYWLPKSECIKCGRYSSKLPPQIKKLELQIEVTNYDGTKGKISYGDSRIVNKVNELTEAVNRLTANT